MSDLDTIRACLYGYSGPGPIPDAEGALARVGALAAQVGVLRERVRELEAALAKMTAPCRPDGTWNIGREACRQIALSVLTAGGETG